MWREIRFEIAKILAQKKTYIVLVGHLALAALIWHGLSAGRFDRMVARSLRATGLELDDIIDGFFFARTVLIPTLVMILPIFICTLAGDIVAGEVQDGSLKLYAARARTRTRILLSKILAMYICAFVCCLYFTLSSMGIGILLFGPPGVQVIPLRGVGVQADFTVMTAWQAFARNMIGVFYHSFSIMALGSITLLFSCLFNRMTAATVAGVTVYFVSYVLQTMPFLRGIKPYLLSQLMNGSRVLSLDPVPSGLLIRQLLHLAVYIVLFCGASLAVFHARDIR